MLQDLHLQSFKLDNNNNIIVVKIVIPLTDVF
jgi:hypothetical protein